MFAGVDIVVWSIIGIIFFLTNLVIIIIFLAIKHENKQMAKGKGQSKKNLPKRK